MRKINDVKISTFKVFSFITCVYTFCFSNQPLARLGATVIGVDATPENIEVAQHHLSHDPTIRNNVKYICGTAEDLVGTESEMFDAVVCSEVLEHVTNKEDFIATCVSLVKVYKEFELPSAWS